MRVRGVCSAAVRIITGLAIAVVALGAPACVQGASPTSAPSTGATTPIQHLVIFFQENVSFDHYFATYPHATNPSGEPSFTASGNTPSVDGLDAALLTHNPNAANPKRLDRSQAVTCDQDHGYLDEQKAFDSGAMDKFVEAVSGAACADKSIVMDYYDGNTVTALWNYAQRFAISDHFFGTTFGPSTVGALNLIAGQTHGATPSDVANNVANSTVIGDPRPTYDDCSSGITVAMSGANVGDLLNAKGITWGWFQGGFKPSSTSGGKAVCGASHHNIAGANVTDYIPHHEPFQYFQSTANPHHLPASSTDKIGQTDQANHQYDLGNFWSAVNAGKLPAVSFLKAAAYQDGHAGYSDPLDEQAFLVDTINQLEGRPEWSSMAILIAYDDSDGWYDHVASPNVSHSSDAKYDYLYGSGLCSTTAPGSYQDRCGLGPRLPLLVISPFARSNAVDHTVTDQSSILRFIEDNWSLGRIGDQSFDASAGSLTDAKANLFDLSGAHSTAKLLLNPETGELK